MGLARVGVLGGAFDPPHVGHLALARAAIDHFGLDRLLVLVVELLGRSSGVGFQLGLYFQLFDVKSILAYALSFIAVVQAIEWGVIQPLERRANRWRR